VKILLADDSAVMRKIVIRTLRQAGFVGLSITEVSDGRQLVDALAEGGFDLVLSDWNMPNVTGIEALRLARATGYSGVFGFVTSESSSEMANEAKSSGAEFLITKPFTADIFEQTLGAFVP
jgi:two-component system chemotaxis response regulator CheY